MGQFGSLKVPVVLQQGVQFSVLCKLRLFAFRGWGCSLGLPLLLGSPCTPAAAFPQQFWPGTRTPSVPLLKPGKPCCVLSHGKEVGC